MRLVLPVLEPLLAENVAKEARKDARVVHCAAQALALGTPPGAEAAQRLLLDARNIDRQFLDRVGRGALELDIPYDRIEPLRRQRIEQGLDLAYRILDAWRGGGSLRGVFPPQALEQRLLRLLTLYCEETAELGAGVRATGALSALRGRAAGKLREAMTEVATGLAHDVARAVHRPRIAAQKNA
jgi:hypothetical protein